MRERLFNAIYGCERGLDPDMALERLRRFLGLERLMHDGFAAVLERLPDATIAEALLKFEAKYPSIDTRLARLAVAS